MVDVFDGLEISYNGFSGKGYVSFNTENCNEFAKNYVYFKCDENNLSNGDIIYGEAPVYVISSFSNGSANPDTLYSLVSLSTIINSSSAASVS